VAEWMQRYFNTRDRQSASPSVAASTRHRGPAAGDVPDIDDGAEPYLARLEHGSVFVIEADAARPLRSGLLGAAVSEVLGDPLAMTGAQFEQFRPGPPVEVLEAPKGPPFLVIGGRRFALRGLPLPTPITAEEIDMLPDGPELDVAAANVGRRRTTVTQAAQPLTPTNGKASGWMETLQKNTSTETPYLVRKPNGKVFLIEGSDRRAVKSGLLAAALERDLGAARVVTGDELQNWTPSVPVEVFEAPEAAPFVVVGGQRLPVRGLPPFNAVSAIDLDRFPKGKPLNVASANVPRSRYEAAISGRYQIQRLRSAVARRGVLGVSTIAAKRGLKTVRKRLG
jgi:hypothetical protein